MDLAAAPLVSVITPTWKRDDLLLNRCIPSVRAQTYPHWEHIVVIDGPDVVTMHRLRNEGHGRVYPLNLPEHPADVLYGSLARTRGQESAVGSIIAHLDDDNAWRPNHLELLVEKLLMSDADFAYSQMLRRPQNDVVGAIPPAYGNVDTSLLVHRRSLLQVADWAPHPTRQDPDWEIVEKWVAGGARWTFVPEITVDYFLKGYPG